MLHLPARFATVILPFASMFVQQRTWWHAQRLLLGALLTPGQRTVCAILRVAGLRWERHFVTYHRVLNRAAWRERVGTRLLFDLLVAAFAPHGPVLLGVDDTIERRRGKRISAKGIYRGGSIAGDLSRPGALVEVLLRQDLGPALAQSDAAGADRLGWAGLGLAVPDRAGTLGAVLPRTWPAPQEADRLGAAGGVASPSMAARA